MLPYKQGTLFYFTYNLTDRTVEHEDSIVETYGLRKFYDNMPYSFMDEVVFDEDREAYAEVYRKIEQGERYATCDFRVKGSETWSRVSLHRDSKDSPLVGGFVQDVSDFYTYVIEQAEAKAMEERRRLATELDNMLLINGISDAYDMIFTVNLSRNTYHIIDSHNSGKYGLKNEGIFDELIDSSIENVAKEFREAFRNSFARENLLKAYNDGQKDIYLEYLHLDDNGEAHWVNTHVVFTVNPYTKDIIEITLLQNIDERVRKETEEEKQRRALEMDALQLLRGTSETYTLIISANLSRNAYHMINYDRYFNRTAAYEGNFDELIRIGASTVPDKHKESFAAAFSRESLLKAYHEGKKDVYLEHQQYDEQGGLHWVSTHVMFTENPYNNDVLEITMSQNIDERVHKETEEEKQRRALEMEALQLLRGIMDTYDLMISANLSANTYHMTTYDRTFNKTDEKSGVFDELIQIGIDRIPDSDKEKFREAFSRENLLRAHAEGKRDVYLEHRQYNDRGELHWLSTHVIFTDNPYNDDVLEITLSQNIDERITKEAESKALLQNALALAESANKAKSDFLSRMSHDIRTPMNAVIGYATIASAHIDQKERVKDSLKKILSSGEHLQGLINDVLDMSRIEAGKESLNIIRTSISEMVRTVLPMIQTQIESKQIELFVDTIDVTVDHVYADAQKIRQILLNILGNAAKFTSNGGKISVKIKQSPSRKPGHAVHTFLIKDNGIGMSAEFQEHLFEAFAQERTSTNSKLLGTGLGMAIAKNHVDMMGGTISVESETGKGSEFAVKLEFRLQEDIKPDARLEQLNGYRVLVVDDDLQSCESVVRLLKDMGMRTDFTTTGKEALFRTQMAYAEGDSYFAYIIDWIMPDMNGIEIVRRIRKQIGDEVPIIILTAYYWGDIEQEAREAGVTAFCTKPLFASDLTNIFLHKESVEEELSGFHNERILLVEDNELNREIAEFMLAEIGFEVEFACDGQDAVTAMLECEDGYYNYVLMDVQMPIMDGIEATKQIRSSDRAYLKSVPIIALTANAFIEDVESCLNAGMNSHLSKPFKIEDIVKTLNVFKNNDLTSQTDNG